MVIALLQVGLLSGPRSGEFHQVGEGSSSAYINIVNAIMRCVIPGLLLTLCISCIEPYSPVIKAESLNILVVDGYIDLQGTASVKLTRTIALDAGGRIPFETGASVEIRSSDGEQFDLTETDSSIYTATNLHVNDQATYSLYIQTTSGNEYTSDDVKITKTPDIEDISFNISGRGDEVEIRTTTTDVNPDATGYYLFECTETYEYHAPIYATYKFINKTPIQRTSEEQIYTCWRELTTPTILVNTNILNQHLISSQRVASISKSSPKITVRYSILVKQRSISEDEYAFRDQLLKSTEQLGSLFAVIPGAVVGNVHSKTNQQDYILGYFRGQDVKAKRFFIENSDLPSGFVSFPSSGCQVEATCPVNIPDAGFCLKLQELGDQAIITDVLNDVRGNPILYFFASAECGDCRAVGGTTVKPVFW